jgi:hypothetical protein
MALAHLGVSRSQEALAHVLRLRADYGAPAPNVTSLRSRQIEVAYHIHGTWDDIRQWIQNGVPIIAFVQAGELPHWHGMEAQHAVLVVGIEERSVYLHDPALAEGPIAVSADDFGLAWDEMDNRYAVITKRTT